MTQFWKYESAIFPVLGELDEKQQNQQKGVPQILETQH